METRAEEPALSIVAAPVLRRAALRLAPMLVVLAAAVLLVFSRDRVRDRRLARQAGEDAVALQAGLIERELEGVAATVLHFAEQGVLRDFLAGRAAREDVEREYVHFCSVSGACDQLRLIDPDGRELLRVNYGAGRPAAVPEAELQDKAERYYFRLAWPLERQQLYVSPLDLNVEHDRIEEPWKPVLRLATPVFDEAGAKRALLVFNFLGRNLLDQLAAVSAQAAGWTGLVNRDGYYLEGPSPELSWGFQLEREPTFARAHPEAWAAIGPGTEGAFTTAEGQFTYRSVHPGGPHAVATEEYPSELEVVSFVPLAEVYSASRHTLELLLWVAAVVVAMLVAAVWRMTYVGVRGQRAA